MTQNKIKTYHLELYFYKEDSDFVQIGFVEKPMLEEYETDTVVTTIKTKDSLIEDVKKIYPKIAYIFVHGIENIDLVED